MGLMVKSKSTIIIAKPKVNGEPEKGKPKRKKKPSAPMISYNRELLVCNAHIEELLLWG